MNEVATGGHALNRVSARSGQTHYARAVPAKTTTYKRFKFSVKSSAFKPKFKTFTETFLRPICEENLIIVIHQAYRLVIQFTTVLTFSHKY